MSRPLNILLGIGGNLATVFFSYSHADEDLRDHLEKHLTMLKRQGVITTWHDRRISSGTDIDHSISRELDLADVVLLLVSPDFLASDYCYDAEMRRAMERHNAGDCHVIPVILRHCDWHSAPFGKLLASPKDGKPIKSFADLDEAFLQVARTIKTAVSAHALPTIFPQNPHPISLSDAGAVSPTQNQIRRQSATRSRPEKTEDAANHTVVLVHGIRDFALWQQTVGVALKESGFDVYPTNYGRFDLIRFLIPIAYFRNRATQEVLNQIRIVKEEIGDARDISIIAHSFGTFVVSSILQRNFDLKFKRVIFCGSVVNYRFPFEQFRERFEAPILNEVGARDIWPAIAESITWGYGSAGTYGFRRPLVQDRWHDNAGHGYFLNSDFCRRFWVPFLRNRTIVSGSESPVSPWFWVQLLSVARLKYFLAFLLALILASSVSYSSLFPSIFKPRTATIQAGPATIPPNETRNFGIDLKHAGYVDFVLKSITPVWTEQQMMQRKREGKGNTPELFVHICSAVEGGNCPAGLQKGVEGSLRRQLEAGPATVSVFNFGENPPVTLIGTITYPE